MKMYVEVYQDGQLKNTWNNQQDITMQLLSYFFRNKNGKNNNFTIKIKDNGEDAKITITTWFYNCKNEKEKTILNFYNVPMNYGWIDTYKINKLIEEEIKEMQ